MVQILIRQFGFKLKVSSYFRACSFSSFFIPSRLLLPKHEKLLQFVRIKDEAILRLDMKLMRSSQKFDPKRFEFRGWILGSIHQILISFGIEFLQSSLLPTELFLCFSIYPQKNKRLQLILTKKFVIFFFIGYGAGSTVKEGRWSIFSFSSYSITVKNLMNIFIWIKGILINAIFKIIK